MLNEYKIPITAKESGFLEAVWDGEGGWFLFRDALKDRCFLMGYFEGDADAAAGLKTAAETLGKTLSMDRATVSPLRDRDWREAYKEHFHAWHFLGLHWVPVWEKPTYRPPEGDEVLWLDPGMAFGTGNHETTRLCVERLIAFHASCRSAGRDPGALAVLDAGCGSGILALSAAKLGFDRVSGFDNDPEAVRISDENAAANNLAGKVRFSVNGLPEGLLEDPADLVLANIQSDVLCRFAPELLNARKSGGLLVLSGILAAEAAQVRRTFTEQAPGLRAEGHTLGEWADLVLAETDHPVFG